MPSNSSGPAGISCGARWSLALAIGFILPIPWALRWFVEWYVSQIVVTPRAASAAITQPLAA